MKKSMPGYIEKVWMRFYGANVAPKLVEAPHVWTAPPIWPEPAAVNHTHRLLSAAFHTRKNPPPRNCQIPSVFCPIHRLYHPRYLWLHRNKHRRQIRTRCRNGRLPFKFLRKQSQSKNQVLRQQHAIMRPHRLILPVRVKSALTRFHILLPFHRRCSPPTA